MQQGIHHFRPRFFEQSLDRPARDTHPFAGRSLIETFLIAEPKGLELAELQADDFEIGHRDAARFEDPDSPVSSAMAALARSGHGSLHLCAYAQYMPGR